LRGGAFFDAGPPVIPPHPHSPAVFHFFMPSIHFVLMYFSTLDHISVFDGNGTVAIRSNLYIAWVQ
jgi:hypothetical protein